jgi:hypothetical protein
VWISLLTTGEFKPEGTIIGTFIEYEPTFGLATADAPSTFSSVIFGDTLVL